MTPKLALRIASGLMIFHVVGHSIGLGGWKKTDDPVQHDIIGQMIGHKFPFMGATRSLAEFYEGFGYAATIAMLLIAVLFWILSGGIASDKVLAKKIITALAAGLAVWAADELIFFFPFAAGNTLLAAVFSLFSLYLLTRQTPSESEDKK
jgi:hypothetical protein